MMINKRLISTVPESKKYIAGNVFFQWCSLAANIVMILSITNFLEALFKQQATLMHFIITALAMITTIIIRSFSVLLSSKLSFLSSKEVKRILREKIYEKLLCLGVGYKESVSSSQIVLLAVEGVEQLETYFGSYLPQFFYSLLAPLTLFVVLCFINVPTALVLLICVPLIPVTIAAVQTFAKKLLAKYWGQYTALSDNFLENIQGLTTLKIYQSDEFKNQEMNREAESFRKITMKVLTMQLNSVTMMDVIAFGGAALGIIMSVMQFKMGLISLSGCLTVLLISADFFIPMRMLGSFFHIAMNGMTASEKIFSLLDLPENCRQDGMNFPPVSCIQCQGLEFSYEKNRKILQGVDVFFPQTGLTAIVGESGCGKSTLASILIGKNKNYVGKVTIGTVDLSEISEVSLQENITYVSFDSYLFKGSVLDNLLMGNPNASETQLWDVLDQVNLSDFLKSEKGLDTLISEKAANFSGGQRQRLCLARAILHNSPIYIFDEATSNIDVESEALILSQIYQLSKTKSVLLITHRLANAQPADMIYVLEKGTVIEYGQHDQLLSRRGVYAQLFQAQSELENYKSEAVS